MQNRTTRRLALVTAGLASTVALALAVTASAATRNGITPLSPKAGASIPAGKSPTMRARVRGKGTVWFHVCKSRRRNKSGVICHKQLIRQARRRKGSRVYVVKPELYSYDGYWLNRPGVYYWQAFRIFCKNDLKDCNQEGPVVKFRVR